MGQRIIISEEEKRNIQKMYNVIREQSIVDIVKKGIETGGEETSTNFVMRQGGDGKWNWVQGDPNEKEHTTKKVFNDYVIYSRTNVPSSQRNQVQPFMLKVASDYDNLTQLLTSQEVANILGMEFKEGEVFNPYVTTKDGNYNYQFYFKK